jgi:hypothetical protein
MYQEEDERTLQLTITRKELHLIIASLAFVAGDDVEILLRRFSNLYHQSRTRMAEDYRLHEVALVA